MKIPSLILATIGAVCLWFAVVLIMTGSLRTEVASLPPAQQQAFWLTGGAMLCFIWAMTLKGKRDD